MTGSLVIFTWIVISYFYTSQHLVEKVKLKQSQGWITFVLLGANGTKLLMDSLIVFLIFWIFSYFFAIVLSIPFYLGWGSIQVTKYLTLQFWTSSIEREIFLTLLFLIIIFVIAKHKIDKFISQNSDKQLGELRAEIDDGKICIIIDALRENIPVKISLKSRKIYIGVITSEHFEPADLDNIIIIPYFSGYRDSETLKLHLDTNYAEIYEKNKLFPSKDEDEKVTCDDDTSINVVKNFNYFRCVISSSEVESISFFNIEYFQQFSNENKLPAIK